MKKIHAFLLVCIASSGLSQGVRIGPGQGSPDPSAGLEISFSDKGLLPPRMTSAERDAIVAPAEGLRIFNTNTNCENFFNGTTWRELCGTCTPGVPLSPLLLPSGGSGTAFFAPNTSGAVFTIQPSLNATNYNWTVPNTWTITSGNGTTSITVDVGPSDLNGMVYVTASNGCGTGGGNGWFVTALASSSCGTVTDIDGYTYEAVSAGGMCWMAENLRVSRYKDNSPIAEITDDAEWAADESGAWANYNHDAGNGLIYGKLYNWAAVTNPAGLCPSGWHMPSYDEWNSFVQLLGGDAAAGGRLKSTGLAYWSPNLYAEDNINFTGLPGGHRDSDGSFGWIGEWAEFWTASEFWDPSMGWMRGLLNVNGQAYSGYWDKNRGMSVRCVKDME
jgi:uncharacterized protein (TIGR02145 family)